MSPSKSKLILEKILRQQALSTQDFDLLCASILSVKQGKNTESWDTLCTFIEVMDSTDNLYPQPNREPLDNLRLSTLPLLAENRNWRNQYLNNGYDPQALVALLLRGLWSRHNVPGDAHADSVKKIFKQWTRRVLDTSDSIGSLEEKIGKTFYGEAWWLLVSSTDDVVALYNLVQKDRPMVLQRWLPGTKDISLELPDSPLYF